MKTYEHVYDILSKSPDFVTGESLAKSLGVSRTAIWKAIQTLQEQGIDITSVRKKGYYLEKGDILLPQDISKQLNIPVYFNPDSNSTQLDAKHGMEKNNPTPALYLASSQKAAKGRFDRHFFAIPQGGIYMSIHLKPNCHFADLPPYTIPTSDLVKVYKEKSLVLDKQVTFEQAGKTYTGVAKEIGDKGQLLVLTDDGQEKLLSAGEVSLTSW